MFQPDPAFLQIYRFQLQRAESVLSMAKANGLQRLEEMNDQLVSDLQRIVKECEDREN